MVGRACLGPKDDMVMINGPGKQALNEAATEVTIRVRAAGDGGIAVSAGAAGAAGLTGLMIEAAAAMAGARRPAPGVRRLSRPA
jgi:hypothetical protein